MGAQKNPNPPRGGDGKGFLIEPVFLYLYGRKEYGII
jgi:hypothetical protein